MNLKKKVHNLDKKTHRFDKKFPNMKEIDEIEKCS